MRGKKKRILNVGGGSDMYGTDFIDLYPTRPEVKRCDFDRQKFPYPNNAFDEVIAKNTIEHLTNLGHFFSECFRVLKTGGRLIIHTDNANYWGYSVGKTHLGGYERLHCNREDRHYSLFTMWHLQNQMRKAGFGVTSGEYITVSGTWPKKIIKVMMNKLLRLTPLWRMSYAGIRIVGMKK